MNEYFWHDFVGNLGVFLILLCYFLLQLGRMTSRSLSYSLFNGLGAMFILVSLFYDFNLSAFIIELAWVFISLFGVYQVCRQGGAGKSGAGASSGEVS